MANCEVKRVYKLEKKKEHRFEVEAPHRIRVQLVDGQAEILGVEMVLYKHYQFVGGKHR